MKLDKKKLLSVLLTLAVIAIVVFVLPKLTEKTEGGNEPAPTDAVLIITPGGNEANPTSQPTEDVTPTAEPTENVTPTAVPTSAPTEKAEPTAKPTTTPKPTKTPTPTPAIDPDGWYYSKDDVALYIHTYGKLPSNFITKDEAEKLGWTGGSVQKYKKGAAIGGTYFGNYAGLLPKKNGRKYYECDIDTDGKSSRGAKRIIYSNDGLIYYTDDHYETFTLLYGNP